MKLSTIQLAFAGIFTAFALAIPLLFKGTLQFFLPAVGYSATLASHVPVMLSIVGGPIVAGIVGIGSTIGFFVTLGPVVAARASTHILFGVVTAIAVKRGMSFTKALFLVALPLHAIPEGLVVIPFGVPPQGALINLVGGTIHHIFDSAISIIIFKASLPIIRRWKLPSVIKS
jgi:niacin transporter